MKHTETLEQHCALWSGFRGDDCSTSTLGCSATNEVEVLLAGPRRALRMVLLAGFLVNALKFEQKQVDH